MPRAEAGSAKALSNKMKSKGLGKLRWYCQICEKQCRDDNGFQCHIATEGHLRKMLVVGESAGKHIGDYTDRFQGEFVALLSRRWGTKRVRVNQVYQEYICDPHHLHMNSTRFLSLTEFAKHLGRTGVAHVDENEKGWWISWIDTSPRALARAESNQKKERGDIDDEMRQRKLIQEQIERAREEGERRKREAALAPAGGSAAGAGEGAGAEGAQVEEPSNELKRDEGEKLSLSLSFKTPAAAVGQSPSPPLDASNAAATTPADPAAPADPSTSSYAPSLDAASPATSTTAASAPAPAPAPATAPAPAPTKFIAPPSKPVIGFTPRANPLAAKPKPNPLKGGGAAGGNPLKKPNPLKGPSAGAGAGAGEKRKAPMSAVEQIAMEEMARKQRRMK